MALEISDHVLASLQGDGPADVAAAPPEPTATAPAAPPAPAAAAETSENPAASSPGPGGGTEAATSPASWLNDQYRELGKSAGFSDDELGEFQSEAEFNRTLRAIDRQMAAFGQASRQHQQVADPARPASDPPPASQAQASTSAPPPPSTAAAVAAAAKLARVDPAKLKAAGYDEDAIAELAKLNPLADEIEQMRAGFEQMQYTFGAWQQYQAQAAEQQQVYNFHAAVDALDDARFGKAFDGEGRAMQLTNEQHAFRERVQKAAFDIEQGHIARGAPLPPINITIQRARNYAFAEDIRKEERSRTLADVAQQAKNVRPVARQARDPISRFTPPPARDNADGVPSINEEAARIFKESRADWDRIRNPSTAA